MNALEDEYYANASRALNVGITAKPPWRDSNNGFMLHGAICRGFFQIPEISGTTTEPMELVPFSEALSIRSGRKRYTVHFWEHDSRYERVWREPNRYLKFLQEFASVISPDFSTWENMPRGQRIGNISRNFILGAWWQRNGVVVIPNIRVDDAYGAPYCLDGAPRNSIIAISTHGGVKGDRKIRTKEEIKIICNSLDPSALLVYGPDSNDILEYPRRLQIPIIHRPSSHRDISTRREFW